MIVKVYTDIGKKCVILNAKVIRHESDKYYIKYLSPTRDFFNDRQLYKYENEEYEIDDESITEFHGEDERVIGFTPVTGGFVKTETDEDYSASSSFSSENEEYSYDKSEDNDDVISYCSED